MVGQSIRSSPDRLLTAVGLRPSGEFQICGHDERLGEQLSLSKNMHF
jgi:hypothetical protein